MSSTFNQPMIRSTFDSAPSTCAVRDEYLGFCITSRPDSAHEYDFVFVRTETSHRMAQGLQRHAPFDQRP